MCIVTTREKAEALGLRPLARLASWALAGVPPKTMGIGPVPAVRQTLERAGLTLADVDLIELNEAFAAQVLACTRELGLGQDDFARMNVHGSGISLGHPVGTTGGRILATPAARDGSARGALRDRDDVHRWRPGPRRLVRTGRRLRRIGAALRGRRPRSTPARQ